MEKTLRNKWLEASDAELLRECRAEAFHASGHGGQKVNKSSSAVRLTHLPSGLSASSQESRSQTENRDKALKRLRMAIALNVRGEGLARPSLDAIPSERNPEYPLCVAALLDAMAEASWDLKDGSRLLNASPSRLAKILRRDPVLWQEVQRERAKSGLAPLRTPG